jgi:hypothetical protein
LLTLFEYQLSKKINTAFRFRQKYNYEVIEEADMQGRTKNNVISRNQQNYRLTLENYISNSVKLTNKIEWTQINYSGGKKGEDGYLISQGVKWMSNKKFIFSLKITFFQTVSYASRIYDYEEDLPGVFANSALYGKGTRWYLVGRYEILEMIHISAKYSETYKYGAKSIGSGNDEILGDTQGQINAQIEVNF